MSDANPAAFTGSIPEFYDRCLGPVIFSGYAADLARRVAARAPGRVLETAAGTGILTRRLRDEKGGAMRITATDLNPPMLEAARAKFGPDEGVTFTAADALNLPFADDSFDAVACQFGVMFYPDKEQSYREARRVLAPGGHYAFSVWDSHRYNEFAKVAFETVAGFFPADPPQFHKAPFVCHEIDPVKEGLIDAGFTDVRITVLRTEKLLADVAAFARGMILGTPIVDQIRSRDESLAERIIEALTAAYCGRLGAAVRPIRMQAVVFEAA
jgi:SAM-dependent methyltransferase